MGNDRINLNINGGFLPFSYVSDYLFGDKNMEIIDGRASVESIPNFLLFPFVIYQTPRVFYRLTFDMVRNIQFQLRKNYYI